MEQILAFLHEADKLKTILRKTKVIHEERLENSAEHSWHLALMAMTLAPYSAEPIDLPHVLKMLIVHDVVEIDAGDYLVYDQAAQANKRELEEKAAERIFNILPPAEAAAIRDLWEEFEAQQTPESRFAAALDRVQPILSNLACGGHSWVVHGITYEQVKARNGFVKDVIPDLWTVLAARLEEASKNGLMAPTQ